MKALINTIILAVILVAAVMYLRTIPRDKPESVTPFVREDLGALPTTIEGDSLEYTPQGEPNLEVNVSALFEAGSELMALWRISDAAKVFDTLLSKDPDHLDTHLRLVECYAHPTMGAERKAHAHLEAARGVVTRAGGDTLRVAAHNHLFVHPAPKLAIERFRELVTHHLPEVFPLLHL